MRLKITLGTGLVIGVAAIGTTLSQAPSTVARVNMDAHTTFTAVTDRTEACQANEVLPQGTSAIRLRMYAFLGPRVTVAISSDGRVIARGERGSGWTGDAVTVPVNPLAIERSGLVLCFALFLNGDESVDLSGEETAELAAQVASGPLPGRVRVEDLKPGRSTWWSLGPQVARRMGLGHAPSGTWTVLLVIALMGGVVVACSRVILRGLR